MALVVQGKTNKEVASALNITETTVKNHLTNIFRKLKVKNRAQAAVLCSKPGRRKIFSLPKIQVFIESE